MQTAEKSKKRRITGNSAIILLQLMKKNGIIQMYKLRKEY